MYFQTYRGQSKRPLERRLDKTLLQALSRKKIQRHAKLFGLNVAEVYDAYL